jgi:ubiquinone/menaquinone biosynthesis C-methylase UbiE
VTAIRAIPPRDRDLWLDAVLGLEEVPDDMPGLPPGSVPYLPCAVDTLLEVALGAPVGADDVFVDLGAGLGRVVTLVHLISGARAVGLELQPALVAQSREVAGGLGLTGVELLEGDAAAVELPAGTVFFSYASFGRQVLGRVLERLEPMARRRPLVLCAVGFDLPELAWLRPRASALSELVFYDSI